MNRKLFVRADAYSSLGTGHLMRCLALVQRWKDAGGDVEFATYCESDILISRIKKEGFHVNTLERKGSLRETIDILSKSSAECVVLDGYHLDQNYQKTIKNVGVRLIVIDDYAHLEHYYADIILNQNYGAEKFIYHVEPYTRFLSGPKYALLRQEFLRYMDYKKEIRDMAKRLLLTLGGGDHENHTLKILKAINLVAIPLEVKIIIGASNPHYDSISAEAKGSEHTIEILTAIENMAPLMAWADIAVSAGGTTTWELAFMGVPSLLCITVDNQENIVHSLSRDGIVTSLGWISSSTIPEITDAVFQMLRDVALRKRCHDRSLSVVDGRGAERVVDILLR